MFYELTKRTRKPESNISYLPHPSSCNDQIIGLKKRILTTPLYTRIMETKA